MANNIISSLGAGSGIDITSLVSQLVEVERAPQELTLDTRQEKLEAQISGYGQLSSALDELKGSISALANNDLFNARSVTVPSSEAITADSVAPGAQTGSYKIEVLEVASAQSLAMTAAAQSEPDSELGKSGQMTIRFGAWTYDDDGDPDTTDAPLSFSVNGDRAALTLDIESSDSLESIAEKINGQGAGVQASVLQVDGQYQLMLTSPSGESNALEITIGDGAVGLEDFAFNAGNYANVTETQQARDAELKVNGLKVTRDSNTLDDVVSGFQFTLNKAAPGESFSFSITADKSAAEAAIRGFVETYNGFQEAASKLVGYSRDEDNNLVRGELAGDSTARTMINRLREAIGSAVPGVESGFTALTNVGIRTERDGALSISEDELTDALSNNFALFESLFATQSSTTNSAAKVNQGSFASRAVSGTYEASVTRNPTHGEVAASALSHDFAAPLDTSGGGYSFKIQVDGVTSNLIELTDSYASAEELRADLQARINGDDNLKAAGVGVEVGYDVATQRLSFQSREYGSISQVAFTETGANMGMLGLEPTQALIVGTAVTQAAFESSTDTFTTPLDAAAGDYGFKISVDGVESGSINLSGTYSTAEELRADIEAMVNADSELVAAGVGVTVGYDADSDQFSITSLSGGASSEVSFTETGDDMAELGISEAMTGTRGVDVAGSIDGIEAFGVGNVLLPDLDSSAYGLNISVKEGAAAHGDFQFSFSRGFAGELSKLIDDFLSSSGAIAMREDSIQTQLDKLDEDRDKLDTRMEMLNSRLLVQFTAMENIVNSLQSTGDQLEGLSERLPFTASS